MSFYETRIYIQVKEPKDWDRFRQLKSDIVYESGLAFPNGKTPPLTDSICLSLRPDDLIQLVETLADALEDKGIIVADTADTNTDPSNFCVCYIGENVHIFEEDIRPVLITQSNRLNRTSTTVIVAIVTSKLKRPNELTHVVLPMMDGLPKQSMVETEQRKTISKAQLLDYCCTLDEETMKEVTRALHYSEEPDGRDKYRMKRKTQRDVHCAK